MHGLYVVHSAAGIWLIQVSTVSKGLNRLIPVHSTNIILDFEVSNMI